MLHFIYGRTGSGKSGLVYSLAEKSSADGRVLILVPEREAVTAERDFAALSGAGNIDVVTFSRLCNFIFRRKGGLCENYIGDGAKKIITYTTLHSLSGELKKYSSVSKTDTATVDKLIAARSELFRNMISPEDLAAAAEKLSEKQQIAEKLADISLIFAACDEKINEKWSDPDGMISRAAEVCGDYFCDTDVYIDSFFTFTREQYKMLSEIFSSARNVWVTLAYLPKCDRRHSAFRSLSETDEKLHEIAARLGCETAKDTVLQNVCRYKNDELAFLAENMFSQDGITAEYKAKPEHIRVVNCLGAYAEAETVAVDICRRVRGGERYRDIAVIMRETSDYDGIIDAALKKYSIPYFVSRRADIDGKPLMRFIYGAYAIITRDFRTKDVIGYIKTGYTDLSPEECDELENYLIKWNISGKRFRGDEPWVENPRGYVGYERKGDSALIKRVNDSRKKIKTPLLKFSGYVKDCKTVREHAETLCGFLLECGIPEKLKADAKDVSEAGNVLEGAELGQLWRAFCDCLDQTVSSAGDEKADAESFLQLLKLAVSETDIGAIPTSVDEVLVGGAAKVRPLSAKTVYIMGACEGVFPKKVTEDGIFSEYEKQVLSECDVNFSSRLEKTLADELYYFYLIACSPSENLFITYSGFTPSGKPAGKSSALKRIEVLFSGLEEEAYKDMPKESLIYAKEPSLEYAMATEDVLSHAIRDYFKDDAETAKRLEYSGIPLSAAEDRLTEEEARELFGGTLKTSYSRLEKYIKCHFQYFCNYELDLADSDRAGFTDANIGSFIHAALEEAVKYAVSADATEEKLDAVIKAAAEKYIFSVTGKPYAELSARLKHLSEYLCLSAKKFACKIRDEFAQSKFMPMSFELPIGYGGVAPVKIDDGETKVDITGKIDRVDGYEDSDGTLYLRVIDYKKSGKEFNVEKVEDGVGLQMLLYLFSLWENGESLYKRKIVPAGVVYSETNTTMQKEGEEKETFSGMILAKGDDGLDMLRAMEPSLEGKYIKITTKTRNKEKKIIGLDAIEKLKEDVSGVVIKFANELKSGNACAKPLMHGTKGPCDYCKMKPICRIFGRENDEDS